LRRKTKHTENAKAEKPAKRGLDQKRKLDIIGILMMTFSLLLFLAMVSYRASDESIADLGLGDLLRLFGGDPEVKARADITSNWLGLSGALIARFFIHQTVGFFAIVFPILLGIWGWWILRRKDLNSLAYYTNYSVILVFLLSTLGGLVRLVSWLPDLSVAWAGDIGDFLAGLLGGLIGTTGGIIVTFTTIVVLAVIVVDYDIHTTLDRLKHFGILFARTFRRQGNEPVLAEAAHGMPTGVAALEPERPSIANVSPVKAARRARRPEPEPLPQPVPIEPVLKRTPVTISRSEEPMPPFVAGPNGTSDEAVRSNGVIPLESIRGLTDAIEKARQEGVAPIEVIPVTEKIFAPETDQTLPPGTPAPEQREDAAATAGIAIVNEHEKRAVQQAVIKQLLNADTEGDSEESNKKMSLEKLNDYQLPGADLLDLQGPAAAISNDELKLKADLVTEKLAVFGIGIKDINVIPGPVVTQFELVPDSSVKISKIVSLADDLALALAAKGIRIIAPIPGKSAVGVEIPNNAPEIVRFRSVVSSPIFQKSRGMLPLVLGKSIIGEVVGDDLFKMPHLLIAGATGSGKSVGVNVLINSLLFRLHPSDVKFIMIDPKKIELALYRDLGSHFLARCPDISEEIITDPANAVIALKSLELEMDKRYTKLAKAGVRHVNDYNAKIKSGHLKDSEQMKHYKLPYIVVVIDELADLMMTAAREVEEPIARLAQLARAVGIHLVVATQRPSVDIITGVIKANFSARIAYQVASRIDSRTILDTPGADRLLGNGDMLYQPSGQPKPVRIQNAFLSTEEVERVVQFIAQQDGFAQPYMLPSVRFSKKGQSREDSIASDDLLHEAARLIVRHQQGSVSLLQRRLKIGYSRAARIVDQLEVAGIVGPYDGSKAREVLVESEDDLEMILDTL
jgi:DNA segregation ATPase FtsK/SpoIIIE, S-DNA-T family